MFFIPQRSLLCERVLKAEGVYGDVTIADIPVNWVPLDTDLLSLEQESTFKVGRARLRPCLHLVAPKWLDESCEMAVLLSTGLAIHFSVPFRSLRCIMHCT